MQKKIGLMIIGAQKAGTTSLNHYLSQHPRIYTHLTLEFGMFSNLENYNQGFDYYFNNAVSDKKKSVDGCVFIAKSVGLMYKPDLLSKLKEHNPDVKVVIVLRNPVERAFSAFWYCKKNGIEPYENFRDAILLNDAERFKRNYSFKDDCDYVGRSSYLKHVNNVMRIFPPENVKVLLFEEIITEPNRYLNNISGFVGLEEFTFDVSTRYNEGHHPRSKFFSKVLSPRKNTILKKIIPLKQRTKIKQSLKKVNSVKAPEEHRSMEQHIREHLVSIFQQDIDELETLTNLPLKNYWNEFFINGKHAP